MLGSKNSIGVTQQLVLDYFKINPAPTYKEIAEHIGINPTTAFYHLCNLSHAGKLIVIPGRSRFYRLPVDDHPVLDAYIAENEALRKEVARLRRELAVTNELR